MHWNPKRKKTERFTRWFELRQDILFNEMTITDAAEHYRISRQAIALHLNKLPRIKAAYYNRPWARIPGQQLTIKWYPNDCLSAREVIDDLYEEESDVFVHPPGSVTYQQALLHIEDCNTCYDYKIAVAEKFRVPSRFDCPSLKKLAQRDKVADISLTRHLLLCHYCLVEFESLKMISLEQVLVLLDKELDLYPFQGWDEYLTVQEIEYVNAVMPLFVSGRRLAHGRLISKKVKLYFNWRRFRKTIHDLGLLGHH